MTSMTWCYKCKRYFAKQGFGDHIANHKRESNVDATNQTQYTGRFPKTGHGKDDDKGGDYMICVLHQKKVPCPVIGCHYLPFGIIRKSYMMKCAKGIIREWKEGREEFKIKTVPFFPQENQMVPIDMKTRTVTLMGVPIRLKI